MPARRQRGAAIEDADVVESQETALEHVVTVTVRLIHPPREVESELAEHRLEKPEVAAAAQQALGAIAPQRRPGVNRRVDRAEGPLERRNLPVRVQIPLRE